MTVPATSPCVHIVICIIIEPVIDSMNANVSRALCLTRLALSTRCFSSSSALAHRNAYLVAPHSFHEPSRPIFSASCIVCGSVAGREEEVGGAVRRGGGGRTSRYEAVQGNKEVDGEVSSERVKERGPGEGEHNENRRRGNRRGG